MYWPQILHAMYWNISKMADEMPTDQSQNAQPATDTHI